MKIPKRRATGMNMAARMVIAFCVFGAVGLAASYWTYEPPPLIMCDRDRSTACRMAIFTKGGSLYRYEGVRRPEDCMIDAGAHELIFGDLLKAICIDEESL